MQFFLELSTYVMLSIKFSCISWVMVLKHNHCTKVLLLFTFQALQKFQIVKIFPLNSD